MSRIFAFVIVLLFFSQITQAQESWQVCRATLASLITDQNIGLDFGRINSDGNEDFRFSINGNQFKPLASSFKAFAVLYYFLKMPDDAPYQEGSPVYSMAVYSNNVKTGMVLREVAKVNNWENPIIAFNDFLFEIGVNQGLHDWDYPGSPTKGWDDPRFDLNQDRKVILNNGRSASYYNASTPTDIANGYWFIAGAEYSIQWQNPHFREGILKTRSLLAIRALDYPSPAEKELGNFQYYGKDGALPSAKSSLGRVLNDAVVINNQGDTYILSLMSIRENEYDLDPIFKAVAGCIS